MQLGQAIRWLRHPGQESWFGLNGPNRIIRPNNR